MAVPPRGPEREELRAGQGGGPPAKRRPEEEQQQKRGEPAWRLHARRGAAWLSGGGGGVQGPTPPPSQPGPWGGAQPRSLPHPAIGRPGPARLLQAAAAAQRSIAVRSPAPSNIWFTLHAPQSLQPPGGGVGWGDRLRQMGQNTHTHSWMRPNDGASYSWPGWGRGCWHNQWIPACEGMIANLPPAPLQRALRRLVCVCNVWKQREPLESAPTGWVGGRTCVCVCKEHCYNRRILLSLSVCVCEL